MENWRLRAQKAGLTQRMLARLTGVHENTISRQFQGEWKVPHYVKTTILAYEMMTEEQRSKLLRLMDALNGRA